MKSTLTFDAEVDAVFQQTGSGAVERPVQDKLREAPRSLIDYGGISDLATDNTEVLADAVASLPEQGGRIKVNGGNFRMNGVIDQDCVILNGDGGGLEYNAGYGFHGVFAKGLRPFTTGAGTATLQLGNNDQECRRLGLNNLAISGDDGTGPVGLATQGNQANAALLLKGGVIHMSATSLNLRDGIVSLDVQPGGGQAITCNFISHFDIRNYATGSDRRTIRMRRPADPDYLTALYFCNGHLNGPSGGYCIEADGTGGPGLTVEMTQVYADITGGHGVLLKNASLDVWNLTLDPGALGAVVVETTENPGADITNYISGHLKHGGQKFKWGDGSTTDMPATTSHFFRGARIYQPFLSDVIYFTGAADPFNTSVYLDWQTTSGPMRLNGIEWRVTDTTDATNSSAGAIGTSGGISAAKSIWSGAAVHCTSGFFYGGTQVIGARQAAPPADATDLASAIVLVNSLKAIIQAHGLSA